VSCCCTGWSVGGAFLSGGGGAGCAGAGLVGAEAGGVCEGACVEDDAGAGVCVAGVCGEDPCDDAGWEVPDCGAAVVPCADPVAGLEFCPPANVGLPIKKLESARVVICRNTCCIPLVPPPARNYTPLSPDGPRELVLRLRCKPGAEGFLSYSNLGGKVVKRKSQNCHHFPTRYGFQ
jgi:hypothetical protein